MSEEGDAQAERTSKRRENKDPVHVAVRGLRKSYGDNEVLRGIDFDVKRGKINVIIGGSGAGKSVLMRQIVRLEEPDDGKILLDNEEITHLSNIEMIPYRKKMGMVFQMSALFDSMSVYDNVAFILRENTDMKEKEIRERVMERLKALEIEKAAEQMPSDLSGGMKRRVAVARSLVMEPELLVYDEPTTGLDPLTSRTVDDLIVKTARESHVTSVVITHDMASVFRIAHVVNYLRKGKVEFTGETTELFETTNEAMREFIDASGIDQKLNPRLSRLHTGA